MNITFIIQFKYDSDDRLKNLIRGVIYLNSQFGESCEILIIDQDDNKNYLEELFESYDVLNIRIESFNIKGPYHRSKIINEGLRLSKYDVCFIYDCDILIPKKQVETSYLLLKNGYNVVFPYTTPQYDIPQNYFENFFLDYDFESIQIKIPARQYGILSDDLIIRHGNTAFGMIIDKSSLGSLAYFNEEFNGWGYEDSEYMFRLDKFGANITRVWGPIFHVEHSRELQNQYNNYTQNNSLLYEKIKTMPIEILTDYYKKLKLIN